MSEAKRLLSGLLSPMCKTRGPDLSISQFALVKSYLWVTLEPCNFGDAPNYERDMLVKVNKERLFIQRSMYVSYVYLPSMSLVCKLLDANLVVVKDFVFVFSASYPLIVCNDIVSLRLADG